MPVSRLQTLPSKHASLARARKSIAAPGDVVISTIGRRAVGRRAVLVTFGDAALAGSGVARAQQGERQRGRGTPSPGRYLFKYSVKDGGLLYYGSNQLDQWPSAAGYVYRILMGEKPADLPVQVPTNTSWPSSQNRQGARPRNADDADRAPTT